MPSHKKNHNHHNRRPNLSVDGEDAAGGDALSTPRSHESTPRSHESEDGRDAEEAHLHDGNGENRGPGDHHHGMTKEEKIANLVQLNDTLVKEISSLRAIKDQMDGKIKTLEEELQNNESRTDALLMEKNWLEDEKRKFELEAASLAKEAAGLGIEKTALLAEKQAVFAGKDALEGALSDSRVRIQEIAAELDEAHRAAASAQSEVLALNSEIDRLRLEKEKMTEENNTLQARNIERDSDLTQLQSKKQSLEEDLANLRNARAAAEVQVIDANKDVEALQAEVSRLNEETGRLEKQLNEAAQRIASLEGQLGAMISRQSDLESQVRGLENDLVAARNAHDNTSSALEQEKETRGSLDNMLQAAHSKSRGLEDRLDSVKSSVLKMQGDTSRDRQLISSLEGKLSCLVDEKTALEKTKCALENEVRILNSGSAEASLKAKVETAKLNEKVKQLELALEKAKDEATHLDRNVYQLKSDLQVVRIVLEEKSKLARLALPAAAVSTSTLAVVAIFALLRRSK